MRTFNSTSPQPQRASRLGFVSGLLSLAQSVLLVSIGALGVTSTAFAANAEVTVTVTPLPDFVSVKRGSLDFFAAQQVTLQNNSTNVINNVSFVIGTSVPGSNDLAPQAGYVETIPASACAPIAPTLPSTSAVGCYIGQLRGSADAAGSMASFVVIFKAPATGSTIPPATGPTIDFNWTATFSSGNSANTPPANFQNFSGVAHTGLITTDDPSVKQTFKTSVPTLGGTFFTGIDGIPTSTDPGTTKVQVPNRPSGDGTATVVETFSDVCAGGFSCVTSTITVPGTFDNLVLTLTRDAAYIKPGLKIENTTVYYTFDGQPFNATTDVIGLCSGFGTNNPLPPDITLAIPFPRPCIAFREQFPKNYKLIPELSGDMRWIIYGRHNGVARF